MTALAPDDAPKPESSDTDTDTDTAPEPAPEPAEETDGADNTGAIEANQVNPDLPLIQPAAD